jgi:hypothetical protein
MTSFWVSKYGNNDKCISKTIHAFASHKQNFNIFAGKKLAIPQKQGWVSLLKVVLI